MTNNGIDTGTVAPIPKMARAFIVPSPDQRVSAQMSMLKGLARRMASAGKALPLIEEAAANALAERNSHPEDSENYRKCNRDYTRAFNTARALEHDIVHYQPCAKRHILGQSDKAPLYRALVRDTIRAKGESYSAIDPKDLSQAVTFAVAEGPDDEYKIIRDRLFQVLDIASDTGTAKA